MREILRGVLQLLFPGVCGACGRALPPDGSRFCAGCTALLTADPHPACPRCAATLGPFVPAGKGCASCRGVRFHFEQALRLGPYDGLLRALVLKMKESSGELTAEFLGALWAEARAAQLRGAGADMVVPVPLHWRRRWMRGYNQSEALARALARALGLPCRPRWLRRVQPTADQVRQTPAGRRINVRGAFRARPRARLRGRAVLLVDDVLTTGSTCSEAAAALRAAGAARVVAAVLARSQG